MRKKQTHNKKKKLGPGGHHTPMECNDLKSAQYIYDISFIIERIIVGKFLQSKQSQGHEYEQPNYDYQLVPVTFYCRAAGL